MLFFKLQETRKQVEEISKRADTARAGELAGQSQLLDMDNGTKMIQSGLLAVESAKNGASLQADQALRRYLDLAALPIIKVSMDVNFYSVEVAYSPNGLVLLWFTPSSINILCPHPISLPQRDVAGGTDIQTGRARNVAG